MWPIIPVSGANLRLVYVSEMQQGQTNQDAQQRMKTSEGALPDDISARLKKDRDGLIAAIVQDETSDEVLMLGWMDEEALGRTLTGGRVVFWSRSRQEYWRKGDTSGNYQLVRSVALDCDGDALLVRVKQHGPACHTGTRSCFTGRRIPAVVGVDAAALETTSQESTHE